MALEALETGQRAGALLDGHGVNETEVEHRAEGSCPGLGELLHRQLSLRDHLFVVVVRVIEPEAAGADVAHDVHREELLPTREAHDRLERPQQLEVSGGRGDCG
jgi:hypothetical protein